MIKCKIIQTFIVIVYEVKKCAQQLQMIATFISICREAHGTRVFQALLLVIFTLLMWQTTWKMKRLLKAGIWWNTLLCHLHHKSRMWNIGHEPCLSMQQKSKKFLIFDLYLQGVFGILLKQLIYLCFFFKKHLSSFECLSANIKMK